MVEIELAKPRIAFGYQDKDITFHVHSKIGIKLDGEMNWIIYDEVDFQFTMDVEVESEVVFASFGQLEFKKGGKDPERKLPIYNDLELTEDQYQWFWAWLFTYQAFWKDYLNDEMFA
jgi:hypothetical protein